MVIGGFITISMTNTTEDRRNPAGWQMVYHTIIHKSFIGIPKVTNWVNYVMIINGGKTMP